MEDLFSSEVGKAHIKNITYPEISYENTAAALKYYSRRLVKIGNPPSEPLTGHLDVVVFEPLGVTAAQCTLAARMMAEFTIELTKLTDEMNAGADYPSIKTEIDIIKSIPKLGDPLEIEPVRNAKIAGVTGRVSAMDVVVYCLDEGLIDVDHLECVIGALSFEQYFILASFQPSFTDARLLFCSGQYPGIVVMHAMQLSNLYVLSSNAHPNWIQDFSIFTHAQLKQEVVLGVANSGIVTVWTLTGKETLNSTNYEHESRVVYTKSPILQIHCCEQLPRLVLLICTNEWRILDAFDCSTQTLQTIPENNYKFTGGSFFNREYIAIFLNSGEALIYRLSKDIFTKMGSGLQASSPKTKLVIKLRATDLPNLTQPIGCLFQHIPVTKASKTNLFRLGAPENTVAAFICGRFDARMCAWSLTVDQLVESGPDEYLLELNPFLQTNLADIWRKIADILPNEPEFFNPALSATEVVTACIMVYLSTNTTRHALPPLLIRGTATGDIIITSPSNAVYRFSGHKGAVLSLLHPFSFNMDRAAFQPGLFLSGGEDFAVKLWDLEAILSKEEREIKPLEIFYNHAGPIISLSVGPLTKSPFGSGFVLAVADDGTVSVVSPNKKYTLITARTASGGFANTPGTVHAVSWRLAEMMLMILSTDGSLAIWDLHTGQLERIETGPTAMGIFNAGTDLFIIGSRAPPTPLTTFCPVNQSASAASAAHQTAPGRLMPRNRGGNESGSSFLPPIVLQSAGATSSGGFAAFVFHFDLEAIINNILTGAVCSKDLENVQLNNPLSLSDCGVILKYLLSVIYPWSNGEPSELEHVMLGLLQLLARPSKPYFGSLSIAGFLALQIPNPNKRSLHSSKISTIHRLVLVALADALCCMPADRLSEIFPHSTIPIDSFLQKSVLSPSHSKLLRQMRLHSLIARWQAKCPHVRYSARALTFALIDVLSDEERRALTDQWIAYLPEVNAQSENQKISQSDTEGSTALDCCEDQDVLKVSIELESGIFDSFAIGPMKVLTGSAVHRYRIVNCAILTLAAIVTRAGSEHLSPSLAARDICVELNCPSTSYAASLSPCYDSDAPDVKVGSPLLDVDGLRNLASALMSYVDLDPSLNTKKPASSHTSPLRRTAIDFLGRGIQQWEPYLDIEHLLNSLLSLIADEANGLTDLQPGEVFNERQDVARACRQALWRLAFARPRLIILTFSLMLRRLDTQALNAMLTSNPSTANMAGGDGSQRILRVVVSSPALAAPILSGEASPRHLARGPGYNPQITNLLAAPGMGAGNGVNQQTTIVLPLIRAAPEVLRVLMELTSRRGLEMTPILPELVEVVLVCVNRTKLKERGLNAVFPILQRFHSVDSHTRAQKVCVGGLTGKLIFLDFKIGRYYVVENAHRAPINAVCFNPDGRQVASYSMQENVLKTWQLSSTGLFGIGAQQVKPINAYPIRPLQRPGGTSAAPLDHSEIALSWTDPAVVNLLHCDVLIRSVALSI
ncbi:hypothetical protein Aperf_G00000130728 [Anoplocephala perfoliata]